MFLELTKIKGLGGSRQMIRLDAWSEPEEGDASGASHALPRRRFSGRVTPRTLSDTALGERFKTLLGHQEDPLI